MEGLQIITLANVHDTILKFISENDVKIEEYEHMKECILRMIREKYIFNMGRDRLRDAMEDLTYILNPDDELNKDRVNKGLEYEYSDDEISDDEEDVDDMDMMSFLKTMGQMRGGMPPRNVQSPMDESEPEDPVVESEPEEPVVEPVSEDPVVEPVSEEPVVEPVSEDPVVEPVSEDPVVEPVSEDPVVEPEKTGGAE
jgi:hypothetical protein